MLFSELQIGQIFYFLDCSYPYKKIMPFDDFPCIGCVLDIEENVMLHIYEDEIVQFYNPLGCVQLNLFE